MERQPHLPISNGGPYHRKSNGLFNIADRRQKTTEDETLTLNHISMEISDLAKDIRDSQEEIRRLENTVVALQELKWELEEREHNLARLLEGKI